ncbi:hypothetical protein [Pseudoponticoccus marisrubri]|uniref:hypothetical protein n=1 Tax=Pseudoponticoccus marisrubri TaxID=1685382 RepID=UPI0012FE3561|nr:hypothetical protein [Pseudoponticoccus marisrubri]
MLSSFERLSACQKPLDIDHSLPELIAHGNWFLAAVSWPPLRASPEVKRAHDKSSFVANSERACNVPPKGRELAE